MSLESRNYVATLTDVEAIAESVVSALDKGSAGRATYFSALIATTQHDLGSPPRQRSIVPTPKVDRAERDRQLEVLEAVHVRFMQAVVKAVGKGLPSNAGRRGGPLQRKTNFARSAMTTVRQWIRAGNDITSLAAARATKYALSKDLERRRRAKPSSKVLSNQTARWTERLTKTVTALADTDKEIAREAVQAAMGRLQTLLAKLGTAGVRPHKGRGGDGTTRRVHAAA